MIHEYPQINGIYPEKIKSLRVPRNSKGEVMGEVKQVSTHLDRAIYEFIEEDIVVMIEPEYEKPDLTSPNGWTVSYSSIETVAKANQVDTLFSTPEKAIEFTKNSLNELKNK